jgi:hypothetical protein
MELIGDLVFGETSRVYKVGIFSAADIEPDGRLKGLVIDRQKGGPSLTNLFLFEYLGCQYVADAGEVTRRYYEAAREHFDTAVSDPDRKSRYVIALASDLESQRPEVDPQTFAREHLDEVDRQPFLKRVGDAGVPRRGFAKSTAYVSTQLVRYETEHNIVVVADRGAASELVKVNRQSITIHDKLAKVATQGRKGRREEETEDDEE